MAKDTTRTTRGIELRINVTGTARADLESAVGDLPYAAEMEAKGLEAARAALDGCEFMVELDDVSFMLNLECE